MEFHKNVGLEDKGQSGLTGRLERRRGGGVVVWDFKGQEGDSQGDGKANVWPPLFKADFRGTRVLRLALLNNW